MLRQLGCCGLRLPLRPGQVLAFLGTPGSAPDLEITMGLDLGCCAGGSFAASFGGRRRPGGASSGPSGPRGRPGPGSCGSGVQQPKASSPSVPPPHGFVRPLCGGERGLEVVALLGPTSSGRRWPHLESQASLGLAGPQLQS